MERALGPPIRPPVYTILDERSLIFFREDTSNKIKISGAPDVKIIGLPVNREGYGGTNKEVTHGKCSSSSMGSEWCSA